MPYHDLLARAIGDIETLSSGPRNRSFRQYLLTNWYSTNMFMKWGYRSAVHSIPLTRTTMLVESHWRLLKRKYLVMRNRPLMEKFRQNVVPISEQTRQQQLRHLLEFLVVYMPCLYN